MFSIPTRLFLTSGVGVHRHRLPAFGFALRDADIEQQNIVSVSSILPSRCQLIPRAAGVDTLRPGEITFCVMARAETSEPSRRVHASIGLTRPADPAMYGYIFGVPRLRSTTASASTSIMKPLNSYGRNCTYVRDRIFAR